MFAEHDPNSAPLIMTDLSKLSTRRKPLKFRTVRNQYENHDVLVVSNGFYNGYQVVSKELDFKTALYLFREAKKDFLAKLKDIKELNDRPL